jgi:glycosyltransferase involved in cell wall biosynthesis
MVILEALAVGTSVLVMPSCGFAEKLKRFESTFVADTEDLYGLNDSLIRQKTGQYRNKSHLEIAQFCAAEFGIESVVNLLLGEYMKALSYGS